MDTLLWTPSCQKHTMEEKENICNKWFWFNWISSCRRMQKKFFHIYYSGQNLTQMDQRPQHKTRYTEPDR